MSHHLDSPLARKDPRLDLTDLYVFKSATGTVFVMDVNTSLAGGTAGFHPEGRYEFKVHIDGGASEALTFRFTFTEADGDGRQSWAAFRLEGESARDDLAAGQPIGNGVTGQAAGAGGIRIWAGRAFDPFYLDLAQLAAIDGAVRSGQQIHYGEWTPATAKNTFAGSSIHAIVLEIPFDDATLSAGRRIGAWATTKLATDAGGWHPINRAGLPMIWPIFRPDDSEVADHANLTRPEADRETYREAFSSQVAALVQALGTSAEPRYYGARVAATILPDLLPYEVGSEASFGFSGVNGRFLSDNAPEVLFSLVADSAVSTGLRPDAARVDAEFPFVVPN